jgi:anti-sigma factor RsiW
MATSCDEIRQWLGSFYDRELHGSKFDVVEKHVRECASCAAELKKLERTSEMLRAHYANVAASADLSDVWNRVDAAVAEFPEREAESFRERLIRIFSVPKPAWAAVGLVAIALIIAVSILPNDKNSTFAANDCIIDSVESEDYSVMVYEVGDTRMKVIWVMEQQTSGGTNATGATT